MAAQACGFDFAGSLPARTWPALAPRKPICLP